MAGREPSVRWVTPENLTDVTQQWKGAVGITGNGTTSKVIRFQLRPDPLAQ